ncbi:PF20097 family protein [Lachnoclostridium phytofermentans]|uniref:DUF6487 domain-containing protein n=1 Tax=Lachnoclostridium phytofermentans (strain ATCC 700394 / DSM 18823 / ISDg) TaxID=357809 RepID=A9KLZ0_LACP7|nr:PF20097 family protein [Lachnoclostridium phytofermentans]ABX41333.1 hypothetical protein Cphy_0951 [Lachnoclostridium phytofermentans ISDg]
MKCPYCNNVMELGKLKIEGSTGLFYLPLNEKYGMFPTEKRIEKKGGIFLDGPYLTRFNSTNISCEACKICKKIIISY